MSGNKMTKTEIADGKQDVGIKVNGHVLIHMPEEGYKSLGITYEQARGFVAGIGELIFALAEQTHEDSKP